MPEPTLTEKLVKLAREIGPEGGAEPRARLLAGFLSQILGKTSKGEIGMENPLSLVQDPVTGEIKFSGWRPGMVDEMLAIPALAESWGDTPPEWSTSARDRADRLHEEIRHQARLKDPRGFEENFDESLGTMLGQIPIPVTKAKQAASAAKELALMKEAREVGTTAAISPWDYMFPTINPSLENYLTGAISGGMMGLVGDEEEEPPPIEKAEGGVVKPLERMMEELRARFAALSNGTSPGTPADIIEEPVAKGKGGKVGTLEQILSKVMKADSESSQSSLYRKNPNLEQMIRLIHEKISGGSQTLNFPDLKTTVLKNPTQQDVLRFAGRDVPEIRMMTDKEGNTYVWDANSAIHNSVMKKLGIGRTGLWNEMSDTPIYPKDYESWLYSDPWN